MRTNITVGASAGGAVAAVVAMVVSVYFCVPSALASTDQEQGDSNPSGYFAKTERPHVKIFSGGGDAQLTGNLERCLAGELRRHYDVEVEVETGNQGQYSTGDVLVTAHALRIPNSNLG